jgi:hypothetical protein
MIIPRQQGTPITCPPIKIFKILKTPLCMGGWGTSCWNPLRELGSWGYAANFHRHAMTKVKGNSSAAQAQTEDQVITAPELTNADIVSSTKMKVITVNGENIINVQSSGNEYQSGKRAEDGKTYSVIRTNITDSSINEFLSEFVEDYNETLSFIVCEQEQQKFLDAVDSGMVDTFKLSVGLRLADKNDEDSDIRTEVNFIQGKNLEDSVRREKLEAERKLAKAKSRFFANESKIDAVFSDQLAKELQMKF